MQRECLGKLHLHRSVNPEVCWNSVNMGNNPADSLLRLQETRLGLVELTEQQAHH